jgi:type IV pilus assembly protein PilC
VKSLNESHNRKSLTFKTRRVSQKVIYAFTRDLSIMLSARMMLLESIGILAEQQQNDSFRKILLKIISQVKSGSSLSESLSGYPSLFNQYYTNLVHVGEVTGRLGGVLERISDYMEKIGDLKRKLVQALTYPSLVVLVAILALSFILLYVIPTFSGIFKDFNAELPKPTLIVLGVSNFFKDYLLVIVIFFISTVFILRRFRSHTRFQKIFGKLSINMPFLGQLIRKNYISQFCRTLGTLLGSGVSLLEALDITNRSSTNYYLRQDITNMKFFAAKGEKLTRSLRQSGIFPLMVVQMIAVGEETAEMPFMLNKIADFYEREIDSAIETLASVIEPVVIVLLGIVIGAILISIYLPLFNLASVMPG